jgi:hypothetical protein
MSPANVVSSVVVSIFVFLFEFLETDQDREENRHERKRDGADRVKLLQIDRGDAETVQAKDGSLMLHVT